MNAKRILSISLALTILLLGFALPALADRDSRDDKRRYSTRIKNDNDREKSRYYQERDYVLDKRHKHNRYYPKRGSEIRTLPRGFRAVHHNHTPYYFHAGIWYRPSGARFTVVLPPVGITVPILPPFYTTIWLGGVPYYYADGVYYNWQPERRVYVVTTAPVESAVTESAAVPDQLFVYPKQDQNEEQQAADRYQCYSWSVEQTGFDPTRSGGNVEEAQYPVKRADYQRAMKACLEARGYSVQ